MNFPVLKRYELMILVLCTLISLILHIYRYDLPHLNEDEVAQGYNTYSVMRTGYDEYGLVPFRYLSFGENKLPVTGLLSVPFILIGGLNEVTIRLPIDLIGIMLPILLYVLAYAFFNDRSAALVTACLTSMNVWVHTLSRHQHEAVVVAALMIIYLLAHRAQASQPRIRYLLLMASCVLIGLLTYHSAKVILPGLAVYTLASMYKKKRAWVYGLFVLCALILFGITEIYTPTSRVANLSFFTSPAFVHEIEEARRMGGSRLIYNKPVYAAMTVVKKTAVYLGPSFFLRPDGQNLRFSDPLLPLASIIEYGGFILGSIWMMRRRLPYRWLILWTIVLSLAPGVASKAGLTVTRTYTYIIPFLVLSGYGLTQTIKQVGKQHWAALVALCFAIHTVLVVPAWSFYFGTYLSSPQVATHWQSGMTQVGQVAWELSRSHERVYVTNRLGQAYIYILYTGGPVDPREYQKVAMPGEYNEYGFWEQSHVGPFHFTIPHTLTSREAAIVSVEDAKAHNLNVQHARRTLTFLGRPSFYVFEGGF